MARSGLVAAARAVLFLGAMLAGCSDDRHSVGTDLGTGPAVELPTEAGATKGWWAAVAESLRASQPAFSEDEDGGIRGAAAQIEARIDLDGGTTVSQREGGAVLRSSLGAGEVRLRTAAWGRGDQGTALDAPEHLDAGCAERERCAALSRPGLVEWWVSGDRGLEQG